MEWDEYFQGIKLKDQHQERFMTVNDMQISGYAVDIFDNDVNVRISGKGLTGDVFRHNYVDATVTEILDGYAFTVPVEWQNG